MRYLEAQEENEKHKATLPTFSEPCNGMSDDNFTKCEMLLGKMEAYEYGNIYENILDYIYEISISDLKKLLNFNYYIIARDFWDGSLSVREEFQNYIFSLPDTSCEKISELNDRQQYKVIEKIKNAIQYNREKLDYIKNLPSDIQFYVWALSDKKFAEFSKKTSDEQNAFLNEIFGN